MSRAPSYDFVYNDKTVEDLGIRPLIDSIEFTEDLDKFDRVKMIVNDGPQLARATDLLQHGSVMQLSMGYINQTIEPMTIVFLSSIEPDFASRQITFTFTGYLKAMDVGERDRSLSNRTIREVVEEVVNDYEVLEVGTIENGDVILSDTTTQSNQTDLSLLESIASQFGLKWKIEVGSQKGKWALSLYKLEYDKPSADNYLPIHAYPEKEYQDDTKSLKLKTFRPKSNILGGVSSRVEIKSNNPNTQIDVTTELKDGESNTTQITGSEIVASVFGEVVTVQFMENVSNEEAAQVIAEQLQQQNELAFVSVPECQLNEGIPNLRVGQTRNVVPHGITLYEKVFAGAYFISGTRHRVDSKEGYNTWVTMNMNALTVPVPETTGFGGGQGTPVWIKVYSDGSMEGWYVNFDGNGVISRGAYITDAQIRANSYWMEHVQNRTMTWISPTNVQANLVAPAIPGITMMSTDPGAFQTLFSLATYQTNSNSNGFFRNSVTDVLIDFPTEWSTDGVAMSRNIYGQPSGEPIEYDGLSGFIQQQFDEAQAASEFQDEFEGFLGGALNSFRNGFGN